ncbi:MAG TPA: DUF6508 domain-containing protein [Amnibacterium sp.]|jgi:hypothetical protein|nr:DUF6508 domain-containing protein [Amnibacterium sp.]
MPDPSDEDVLAALRSAPPDAVDRLRLAVGDYRSATGPLVQWRGGRDPAGTASADSAYPVYDDRVWELLGALQAVGAFVVFDWMHWKRAAVVRDVRLASSAPVADLARLVTVLLRGERFGDGVIAGAVEAGVLPILAERVLGFLDDRDVTPRR